MSIELTMLAFAIVFGLVQLVLVAQVKNRQLGYIWAAGPRDEPRPPVAGIPGRLDRAFANFLETFPFFAAAVLAVVLTKTNTPHTAMGAALYFWARVAYLPIYIVGIPYLRTLVWVVSFWGLLQVLEALW